MKDTLGLDFANNTRTKGGGQRLLCELKCSTLTFSDLLRILFIVGLKYRRVIFIYVRSSYRNFTKTSTRWFFFFYLRWIIALCVYVDKYESISNIDINFQRVPLQMERYVLDKIKEEEKITKKFNNFEWFN